MSENKRTNNDLRKPWPFTPKSWQKINFSFGRNVSYAMIFKSAELEDGDEREIISLYSISSDVYGIVIPRIGPLGQRCACSLRIGPISPLTSKFDFFVLHFCRELINLSNFCPNCGDFNAWWSFAVHFFSSSLIIKNLLAREKFYLWITMNYECLIRYLYYEDWRITCYKYN